MAVVSVEEKQGGGSKDGKGRHYLRRFLVTLDAAPDAEIAALDADDGSTAVPNYGDTHPNNAYARCMNVSVSPTDSRMVWTVEARYDTVWSEINWTEDPLDEDPDVNWGVVERVEALHHDKDGDPLLNSANDWFDPPLEQPRYDLAVTIMRNEAPAAYAPGDTYDYVGTVNSDSTTIAGLAVTARQAKLVEYSANRQERNGVDFWRVTYRIEFRADTATTTGWDREVLDQGINELFVLDGTKMRITGSDGEPVQEPVNLDGDGVALAWDHAPGDCVFLIFQTYPQKAFGALGLNI